MNDAAEQRPRAEHIEHVRGDEADAEADGSPSPVRFCCPVFHAAIAVMRLRHVAEVDDLLVGQPGLVEADPALKSCTRRSGAAYGSGVSSTALTTLKMAEVAPMPSARVMSDAAAKPGLLISPRIAPVDVLPKIVKHAMFDGRCARRGLASSREFYDST